MVFLLDHELGKNIHVSGQLRDDGGPYARQFQITVLPIKGVPLSRDHLPPSSHVGCSMR